MTRTMTDGEEGKDEDWWKKGETRSLIGHQREETAKAGAYLIRARS